MLRKCLITIFLLSALCRAEQQAAIDCSHLTNLRPPKTCCSFPDVFKKPYYNVCHSDVNRGYIRQCFIPCMFTIAGICHEGQCSYSKAVDFLNRERILKGSPFKNIYKRAFKKCIAKANDMRSNMVQRFNGHDCDPLPKIIRFCVRNETFTLCPAEYWNSDVTGCASKRDFIRNCMRDD